MSAALRKRLLASVQPDGGWGYYAGQASRIEPTAWATMALTADADRITMGARRTALTSIWTPMQGPTGLIVEAESGVPNIAFNGLALIALVAVGVPAEAPIVARTASAVVEAKGIKLGEAGHIKQNQQIQAWAWVDGTFSWAEPTAWCLFALKKLFSAPPRPAAAPRDASLRVKDGEAMLIDRVCQSGGWNYGNSNAFTQDLRAYVPTSALGLIAMQDRRSHAAVGKSLTWLEANSLSERSAMALALAAIALSVYDRPIDKVLAALVEQEAKTRSLENAHLTAMTLYALTIPAHQSKAFRL